nr:MAG TPA: hypothetical protein [Caudoviricetes sp.]
MSIKDRFHIQTIMESLRRLSLSTFHFLSIFIQSSKR